MTTSSQEMDMHGRHSHPRTMTARARWYLVIAATRHLLVAFFAIAFPATFSSPSFRPMIAAVDGHLWIWGVVFAGAGLACAAGAWTKRSSVARLGLMLSAASTMMSGVGLLISWYTGDLSSPTGPIIWIAMALADFTVCADPLRSPFEDWAEEFADRNDRDDRDEEGGSPVNPPRPPRHRDPDDQAEGGEDATGGDAA